MSERSSDSTNSLASDIEIVVKQMNLADLTDLARLALMTAFGGYVDEVMSPDVEIRRRDEMKRVWGDEFEAEVEDENYRRFAGDQSLSRGRYYSLAFADSGDDGGTLVQELRTYCRIKYSGVVQIFDTTLPADRCALAQANIQLGDQPVLLLHFFRTRSRPNPFLRSAGVLRHEAVIELPLRVTRRRLTGIVDLRKPSTASSLVRQLTKISWQLDDRNIPAFPFLEQQNSFSAVIPSLIEQNVGGTDFTNVLGLWLRHNGIRGLVYPSARSDAHVNVTADRITSWSGFNYVDYEDAGLPVTAIFVHIASRLPKQVRYCPIEAREEPQIEVPYVAVHFEHNGERAGTWKVEGLRGYHEICSLLSSIGYMLEEYSSDRSTEITAILFEWLVGHANRDTGKTLANVIFHALLGLEQYKEALRAFIRDMLRDLLLQSIDDDGIGLIGALLDIERACQTNN
jgi:hypothetical protein